MEVSGTIKVLGDTQEFGSNGFRKRECVITTNEQYPQTLLVEFTQNNTELLNNYAIGDTVTIQINIRGREWTNPQGQVKYFVSLNGWRMEKMGAAPAPSAPMQDIPASAPAAAAAPAADDAEDDLPF